MSVRFWMRVLWFYIGLAICSLGYAMVIKPGFGAAPWDILHLGLSLQTGVRLSLVVQGFGLVIILIDVLLGVRPNLGMILNMLSVGPMLQFFRDNLPMPQGPLGLAAMFAVGILLAGVGTALYAGANLGTGPRDSLMIALTQRIPFPLAVVKNGLDLTVSLVGWWLGGPLGLGTVVVALCLGPSMQLGFYLTNGLARYDPFSRFLQPVALKRTPAAQVSQSR